MGQLEFAWDGPRPQQDEPASDPLALTEADKEWMRSVMNSNCSAEDFLRQFTAGRKLPVSCLPTRDGLSGTSLNSWSNAGLACAGECLTASISESPARPVHVRLDDVLEPDDERAANYLLAPEAKARMLAKLYRHGGKGPKPEVMEAFGVTQADLDTFVAIHPDGRYYGHPSYSDEEMGCKEAGRPKNSD
jgi:hypothetical protein